MYCKFCGTAKNVHVHHIDGNHDNNAPINRVRLCQCCHSLVHKYLGVAEPEEIEVIAKKAQEMNPSKPPPSLFDGID